LLKQVEFPARISRAEIREKRDSVPSPFITGNIFEADGDYEFEEVEVIGLAD
jgi:hypothetical protein